MRQPWAVNDLRQAAGPTEDTSSDPRIPVSIERALRIYTETLRAAFPERVYAVSLYGSAALGGFSERTSDIDFLTVMVGHVTEEDQATIRALHRDILHADRWVSRLDGEYVELDQIRQGELDAPALFVEHGNLAGRREVSRAGWLTLSRYGIGVVGPPPATFVPEVAWPDLEREMWYNLHEYWMPRARSRLLFLSSIWVAFAVLTLCRIVYTLDYRTVTSKPAAAAYALGILPVEWHRLIREALRLHDGPAAPPLYRSHLARASEARRFIRTTVKYCDARYGRGAAYAVD